MYFKVWNLKKWFDAYSVCLERVCWCDGNPVLGAALHGVQHGHGAAAAQQDQAGAQALRGEELRDGDQDRAPRQDGPPLQERHQAELRHQLGDRRLRETGNFTYLLNI